MWSWLSSSGAERRSVLTDRRHATSERYAKQNAERIRDLILSRHGAACPQCNGDLLMGRPVTHGDTTAREVHCIACRRSVVIAQLPERLPTSAD